MKAARIGRVSTLLRRAAARFRGSRDARYGKMPSGESPVMSLMREELEA